MKKDKDYAKKIIKEHKFETEKIRRRSR